jgi:hypothetical protein
MRLAREVFQERANDIAIVTRADLGRSLLALLDIPGIFLYS